MGAGFQCFGIDRLRRDILTLIAGAMKNQAKNELRVTE
jgi:hypothetical protein